MEKKLDTKHTTLIVVLVVITIIWIIGFLIMYFMKIGIFLPYTGPSPETGLININPPQEPLNEEQKKYKEEMIEAAKRENKMKLTRRL